MQNYYVIERVSPIPVLQLKETLEFSPPPVMDSVSRIGYGTGYNGMDPLFLLDSESGSEW